MRVRPSPPGNYLLHPFQDGRYYKSHLDTFSSVTKKMTTRRVEPGSPNYQARTLPENISLFHLCYFAIISTRSTFTKMANYPGTKLAGVAYKLRKKMKNSPSCVHVLHKTLMWSFHVVVLQRTTKKCTKMKNARAERLFLLIKPIVLRRCRLRPRRRRRCLSSLIARAGGAGWGNLFSDAVNVQICAGKVHQLVVRSFNSVENCIVEIPLIER